MKLQLVFITRPFKFFLLKNWYGIRKGLIWNWNDSIINYLCLVDIGAITLGYRTLK